MESDTEINNCDMNDQWIIESGSEDDLNVELEFQHRRMNESGFNAQEKDAWVVESDSDEDCGEFEVFNSELNSILGIHQGIKCYYWSNILISQGFKTDGIITNQFYITKTYITNERKWNFSFDFTPHLKYKIYFSSQAYVISDMYYLGLKCNINWFGKQFNLISNSRNNFIPLLTSWLC